MGIRPITSSVNAVLAYNRLTEFLNDINQVHPTIKFTYEQSTRELTFMDVTIHKGQQFRYP